jgi:hypothetical protein
MYCHDNYSFSCLDLDFNPSISKELAPASARVKDCSQIARPVFSRSFSEDRLNLVETPVGILEQTAERKLQPSTWKNGLSGNIH